MRERLPINLSMSLLLLCAMLPLSASEISAVSGAGGGWASVGLYATTDTLGQLCVGASASATYALEAGFWPDPGTPPVAVNDTLGVSASTGVTIAANILTANDLAPAGDTLTLTGVCYTGGHGGTVTLSGGHVTYAPAAGYAGSDGFTYVINDGNGNTAVGTVSVAAPPGASDQTFTRAAQLTLKIRKSDVLGACSSPDGYPLVVAGVGASSQGAVLSTNASYIFYIPAAGNNHSDSFRYTVADGHGGSATGTLTVSVVATPGGQAQQISVSGGAVTVRMAGIPGYAYVVLRATDVNFTQNVTPVLTTNAPAHGLFWYTDPAPPSPTAYYRMQTP